MLALDIALAHLTSRKRQTFVSLSGVVLGVAFFLAVSSLMRGSEKDFLKRLVDNSPHITVSDEYRLPRVAAGGAALERRRGPDQQREAADRDARHPRLSAEARVRGIAARRAGRAGAGRLGGADLRRPPGRGDALGHRSGHDQGVSTIDEKIIDGSLDALAANPNGIVIGKGLADKFNLDVGSTLGVAAAERREPADEGRRHLPHRQRELRRDADVRAAEARAGHARPPQPRQPVHHPARRRLRGARCRRAQIENDDRLQVRVVGRSVRGHPERADHPQHHHVQRGLAPSSSSRPSASTTRCRPS